MCQEGESASHLDTGNILDGINASPGDHHDPNGHHEPNDHRGHDMRNTFPSVVVVFRQQSQPVPETVASESSLVTAFTAESLPAQRSASTEPEFPVL